MEEKKTLFQKVRDNWLFLCVLSYLLISLGQIVGGILIGIPLGMASIKNPGVLENGFVMITSMYASFIGIWIVMLLYLLLPYNRPIYRELGIKDDGNKIRNLLLGFVVGFLLNGLCILIAWLHKDIALSFGTMEILPLIVLFIVVFIQSAAEELLCRVFLFQRLKRSGRKLIWVILINSALFAALHLGNDGVTMLSIMNIFLLAILFSLFIVYWESPWCAFAIHASWNYTQNIIFGLPNSGIISEFSIFRLEAGSARDSFAYNVGFGIEGTVCANLLILVAIIVCYIRGRKRRDINLF